MFCRKFVMSVKLLSRLRLSIQVWWFYYYVKRQCIISVAFYCNFLGKLRAISFLYFCFNSLDIYLK